MLGKYHLNNFPIYLHQLDDRSYRQFSYYEHDGSDCQGDMARPAVEKRNIDWLSVTDPVQIPLRGQKTWTQMEEVYHNQ